MKKLGIVLVLVFMSVIAMSQTDTSQTVVKTTVDSIKQTAVEISKTKEYKESKEIVIDGAKAVLKGAGAVAGWLYYEGTPIVKEGFTEQKKK